MNNEYLFIGGDSHGRRIRIPSAHSAVKGRKKDAGVIVEEFYTKRICYIDPEDGGEPERHLYFAVVGLSDEQAFEKYQAELQAEKTKVAIANYEKFVAVGGMLHGRKILVPDGARIVKQHVGTGPTVHYVRCTANDDRIGKEVVFYRVGGMDEREAVRLFLKLNPTNP